MEGLVGALPGVAARAEAEPGQEVCGFVLEGEGGGAPELLPARNVAADPRWAFEVAPGDVLAALRRSEARRRPLAALYHSHPVGGAELSARDRAALQEDGAPLLPGVDLLVVALERGRAAEVRRYRWVGGAYREVARAAPPFTSRE
jgi:proteasome lid subunit RPN8/RPN11